MNLQENTQKLWELRGVIDVLSKKYDEKLSPLRAEREKIQKEIIDQMKSEGQYSTRFSFATVTLAVRKTLEVIDETKVIKYLKKKKLAKEYVALRLNESFEAFRRELAKNSETIPGTNLRETEYISLREPEVDKDRRKVTTEV